MKCNASSSIMLVETKKRKKKKIVYIYICEITLNKLQVVIALHLQDCMILLTCNRN